MSKAKKTARRSFTKSARAGKPRLVEAPPEQRFWTSSGIILSNLSSLKKALESKISDEEYSYHANRIKNDFAKWVGEVLRDQACAKALIQAKNRKAAATAIAGALKRYRR